MKDCPFCDKSLGARDHQVWDESVSAYAHDHCSLDRITWSDVDRARRRVANNPDRYLR